MHHASTTLEPGVILAGKYRIERVLGQGGMGVVAAAYHVHLEQRVALKLMLPHALANTESISRFLREARAAARITSEHVARVYDVGTLESGAPYIAMEYLEGEDLAQLMTRCGRIPVENTVEYVLQACEALAEAHRVGIVHRDLKPANLFLAQRVDGQYLVKVLDFGISKMSGGAAQSDMPATRTSALMGSPLYMSPEQMGSSRDVDARSDIWSIGVVLHEMLSGKPPFDGDTLPQVCARVMSEPPPALREVAPGLPSALYDAVDRCLQKQPASRFQSVAELASALGPVASPRGRQSVERVLKVLGVTPATAAPLAQVAAAATTADPAKSSTGTQANWGATRPKPVLEGYKLKLVAAVLGLGGLIGGGRAWMLAARAPALPTGQEPAPLTPPAPALTAASGSVVGASALPGFTTDLRGEPAPPPSSSITPSLAAPLASAGQRAGQAASNRASTSQPRGRSPRADPTNKTLPATPATAAPAPTPAVPSPLATNTARSRL